MLALFFCVVIQDAPSAALVEASLPQHAPDADPPEIASVFANEFPIHGHMTLRSRTRWSAHDSDLDLDGTLSLELGDKQHDSVTGYLSAALSLDLDGLSRRGTQSAFYSLEDTYGGAFVERIYDAYADFHAAQSFETLRVGRQSIIETPAVAYFDGVRAESIEQGSARLQFGAWGGIPVRLYSAAESGDLLFGAFAQARPWHGARARLDWMHARDDARLGASANDLFGLGLWQSFGANLRVQGEYTRLEAADRDVRLRASWHASESDLVVQVSWLRLFRTQGELAQAFDPLSATLHDLFPYQQFGVLVSKSLSKELDLQAGFDARRVLDAGDIGLFNHDFDRGFATLGLKDVLPAGMALALTGELWSSRESTLKTYGVDLSRRFETVFDASLGTYYSLYKYDIAQGREIDDVRTWYLKLVWNRSTSTRFELRYEFEGDPFDQYHDLRLGMTWRF